MMLPGWDTANTRVVQAATNEPILDDGRAERIAGPERKQSP